jgi:hypothetical protein
MAHSPSVPAAAAVAFSSARCQPVAAESRVPCGARRRLYVALVIVLLSSACRVSTAQGTWSNAQLSVARSALAATSVGNVAIFAGGDAGNCSVALCFGGFASELLCVNEVCLRRVIVTAAFVVYVVQRQEASDEGHCRWWS